MKISISMTSPEPSKTSFEIQATGIVTEGGFSVLIKVAEKLREVMQIIGPSP